jgi:hypothetical protein
MSFPLPRINPQLSARNPRRTKPDNFSFRG